jgi:hypothetical protein
MPKLNSQKNKSSESKNGDRLPTASIKETILKKREAKAALNKLIAVSSTCLAIGLTLGVPLALAGEVKLGLMVAVAIPALILSYIYPRAALWFFLIYLPISGTVTYWIGGGNALFQLGKDAFYIPALIALIQECSRKRKPIIVSSKLLPSLIILLVFALGTLLVVNLPDQFLPACDSLTEKFLLDSSGNYVLDSRGIVIKVPCKEGIPFIQGLIGLKVLIGYVPLIFCAYYLIEDKEKLFFFGRLLVVLAIICCLLGIVQYWMLDSGRCYGTRDAVGDALFKASLKAKCLVGGSLLFSPSQGVIRLPGTFVSPWHWAWFLIGNSAITFTTAFSDPSRFWRFGGLAGLALVFINAVICGQRIALLLVPTVVVLLLILTGQIANLKRFVPIAAILALVLGLAAITNQEFFQQRIDSLIGRWNQASPFTFMQQQWDWAIFNYKGILGRGLGYGTNSARAFGDIALIETFHPKVFYEIGPLGLLAFMVFLTHLTILTFQKYRSVRDKVLCSFASSFWVFILIISYFPYWYPLDTDPVAVYYWFLAGIVFKIPQIDKQEREKLKLIEENRDLKEPKPKNKKYSSSKAA